MLGLAKRARERILQASTSEVYGTRPQPETDWGNVNPIGPRACYDEGKRCADTLFFDYHRQHRLEIKVARIFNTYGPRMQLTGSSSKVVFKELTSDDPKQRFPTSRRRSNTYEVWV
jgi:nucleoside-diphosphate-sugar epimerase